MKGAAPSIGRVDPNPYFRTHRCASCDPPARPGARAPQTDDDASDDVFPEIRVADAVQRVDVDLYSAYVISRDPGPGLEEAELAALPEPSRTTCIRNLLYAVEWWVFGAFAGFIWWRWRRDATAPEVPSPSPG